MTTPKSNFAYLWPAGTWHKVTIWTHMYKGPSPWKYPNFFHSTVLKTPKNVEKKDIFVVKQIFKYAIDWDLLTILAPLVWQNHFLLFITLTNYNHNMEGENNRNMGNKWERIKRNRQTCQLFSQKIIKRLTNETAKKYHERNLCRLLKPESYFVSDSGSFCYSWLDFTHQYHMMNS